MSEYKRQTGKKHPVTKDSNIPTCHWQQKGACIDDEVELCVWVDTVANDSEVIVNISDSSGNVNDTVKGVIQDNKLTSTYTVPENSVDYLTLDAQVTGNYGLEFTSNSLPILRKVTITLIDEYKNELDSHKTFHNLPYLIHTDTGHTYKGKVNERAVIHKIHYKDEYELELLYQKAVMPDTPLETPTAIDEPKTENAEDKEPGPDKEDSTEKASQTPAENSTGVTGSSGNNDTQDFSNYVVSTFEKLVNPVKDLTAHINKLID